MGTTKTALSQERKTAFDDHVRSLDTESFDYKISKLLRYTGMHSVCSYHQNAKIRIIKRPDDYYVVWARPKKGAKKGIKNLWEDVGGVPLHAELDFDIIKFWNDNVKRRLTRNGKRGKVIRAIQRVSEIKAPGTTPNSLRHTFAMELLYKYHIPKGDVAKMIGTTIKTLDDHYNILGPEETTNQMRQKGFTRPSSNNPNVRGD